MKKYIFTATNLTASPADIFGLACDAVKITLTEFLSHLNLNSKNALSDLLPCQFKVRAVFYRSKYRNQPCVFAGIHPTYYIYAPPLAAQESKQDAKRIPKQNRRYR